MKARLRYGLALAALAGVSATSACGYENLNSLALPGDKGVGEHSYTIRVELRDALNIVPNSPVRVDDVNVGTIRSVELVGYQPIATISVDDSVRLPANVSAKIGQTSLLGAKHIELLRPSKGAMGTLGDGDTVPVERTGAYPTTEDVIASVATLLNGGGLAQIKTITTELNRALGGRTATTRELIARANQFATAIDAQKLSMVRALDSMRSLSAGFRANNATITRALQSMPPALRILEADRKRLITTMESLGHFGEFVDWFVSSGGAALVRDVKALGPVLRELADARSSLTDSLWIVPSVDFPIRTMGEYIRGDYINLWGTIDLGLETLTRGLLAGTPAGGALLNPLGFLESPIPGIGLVPGPAPKDPQLSVPSLPSSNATGQPSPSSTPTPESNTGLGGLLNGLLGGGSQ